MSDVNWVAQMAWADNAVDEWAVLVKSAPITTPDMMDAITATSMTVEEHRQYLIVLLATAIQKLSDMSSLPEFFDTTAPPEDPLRRDLIDMITARDHATPRHRQVELGPSEVAHPCMRKMAYGMMGVDRSNPPYDPLPAIIGTATHKWLESAASYANAVLADQGLPPRWLAETRVNVAPGLSGNCDLYDRQTGTVIDWKVPGNSRFDTYKRDPGVVYKTQVYLYGLGFERAGLPVKTVAIALLPRGKTLHSMHVWRADYDPKIAEDCLNRRDAVIGLLDEFQVQDHPERYEWIPITPYDCVWCPWFRPQPQSPTQCRGDQ